MSPSSFSRSSRQAADPTAPWDPVLFPVGHTQGTASPGCWLHLGTAGPTRDKHWQPSCHPRWVSCPTPAPSQRIPLDPEALPPCHSCLKCQVCSRSNVLAQGGGGRSWWPQSLLQLLSALAAPWDLYSRNISASAPAPEILICLDHGGAPGWYCKNSPGDCPPDMRTTLTRIPTPMGGSLD